MDCFGTYFTHVQTCNVTPVQSATEWTASVHALHMSKTCNVLCKNVNWASESIYTTSREYPSRRAEGVLEITLAELKEFKISLRET